MFCETCGCWTHWAHQILVYAIANWSCWRIIIGWRQYGIIDFSFSCGIIIVLDS